ncbi:hypothetical protein BC332_24218 [Capsicum chinense]|nr:hypothetical protein BC332_24218 [Capsicum chinense]
MCPDAVTRFLFLCQIYEYINNSKLFSISCGDVAIQLDLVSKDNGLVEEEKYFASIPDNLRTSYACGALLNCYVNAKSFRKAEGIMQKMRDANVLTYNIMMKLYVNMGDLDKLHSLVQEMDDKRIYRDAFTYAIR